MVIAGAPSAMSSLCGIGDHTNKVLACIPRIVQRNEQVNWPVEGAERDFDFKLLRLVYNVSQESHMIFSRIGSIL